MSKYIHRLGIPVNIKVEERAFICYSVRSDNDVSSEAQLIVFCRFAGITREKIAQHYFFCKPLGEDATASSGN